MSEQKKTETRLRKERIIENVDELYKKYYNAYKSDYETDDELNEAKKDFLTTISLNWLIK